MSTSFKTEPPINYEDVLNMVIEPDHVQYIMPHKLIKRADGTGGTLWVYRLDSGEAEFERFGAQDTTLLQVIIDHFKVKVIDEYGLDWPGG